MSKLDLINGRIKQGSPNTTNNKDKPRTRDTKDSTHKRPLWRSDWKK